MFIFDKKGDKNLSGQKFRFINKDVILKQKTAFCIS